MAAQRTSSWQKRMAPLMMAAVVVTALFFAVVTVTEFAKIENWLFVQSRPAAAGTILTLQPTTFEQQLDLVKTRESFALEREAMTRRYNQGNLLIATRLWTRMMGFVTGMILALIGAAFVLGKLSEDASELTAGGQGMSLSLKSASPGVILCVLGTLLMSLTIWVPVEVSTTDAALYTGTDMGAATGAKSGPGGEQAASIDPGTDDDSPYQGNQTE